MGSVLQEEAVEAVVVGHRLLQGEEAEEEAEGEEPRPLLAAGEVVEVEVEEHHPTAREGDRGAGEVVVGLLWYALEVLEAEAVQFSVELAAGVEVLVLACCAQAEAAEVLEKLEVTVQEEQAGHYAVEVWKEGRVVEREVSPLAQVALSVWVQVAEAVFSHPLQRELTCPQTSVHLVRTI